MAATMKSLSRLSYWYVLFVLAIVGLTVLPAPDHATLLKYHLTSLSVRLLDLTILIPEAFIWFVALYGYSRLRNYSKLVAGNKDGRHIAQISRGLYFLVMGLPITAIIDAVLAIIAAHHPGFVSLSVVIRNYLSILFPLIGFIWISNGTRGLSDLTKARPRLRTLHLVAFITIALGMILCCLIASDHQELRQVYHMSPQLVMLTLALPYMYVWFIGLYSVAELYIYSKKIAGVVYKKAWNLFAAGFASIVIVSILLQDLGTLSSWITHLSLASVLILLYGLLFLLVASYGVVALAAKRLAKIEEV